MDFVWQIVFGKFDVYFDEGFVKDFFYFIVDGFFFFVEFFMLQRRMEFFFGDYFCEENIGLLGGEIFYFVEEVCQVVDDSRWFCFIGNVVIF